MKTRQAFPDTVLPQTAVLEMTYACNHKCIFCSVPWDSPRGDYPQLGELSPAQWKKCIDILVEKQVSNLSFSGGEPTLKAGLEEIIAHARGKKIKSPVFDKENRGVGFEEKTLDLFINTNGESLSDRWIKIFKEYNLSVGVSLPGLNTFGELTGGGDYRKALATIRKASEAGLDVTVSICVTKKNLPELFETISLGFLHGAQQLLLNRFLPGGRGIDHAELCLTRREIVEMLETAEEVCKEANTYGSVGTELPRCVVTREYKMVHTGTLCSGGIDFFAIDPSGKVRPCNHSPVRLGDFRDLQAALNTDYWQKFKCRDFLPRACRGCMHSLNCDGGCREAAHIVSGNLDSEDPLFMAEKATFRRYQTKTF